MVTTVVVTDLRVRAGVLPVLHVHVRVTEAEHDIRHALLDARVCCDAVCGAHDAPVRGLSIPITVQIRAF